MSTGGSNPTGSERPPWRLIVGNLDCESDFAHALDPFRPRPALSQEAMATISGAATLLRVFAREGDRLWTPAPVPMDRVAEVDGLPRPQLVSGPLETQRPPGGILAWGETDRVAEVRAASAGPKATEPVCEPIVAATVNHRGFSLEVARGLACPLPGSKFVTSLARLESHLEGGGSGQGLRGAWVAKAPLSAAGRSRYVGSEPNIPDERSRRRLEGLLARHGSLLFEPWVDREDDFGCLGIVTDGEVRHLGTHRLLVESEGQFRGIEVTADDPGQPDPTGGLSELGPSESERLTTTTREVGEALKREGYRGPFGVDAWRYRTPEGELILHPLGEINARMSFGLVARAILGRLRGPLGLKPGDRVRLLLGREPTMDERVVLLQPTPSAPGAWLQILRS